MKIIKKFWGVALIVVLLSSMFVGSAAPVSAANYNFSYDTTLPNRSNGYLAYIGDLNFNDIAQSGSTIFAATHEALPYNWLFTSPNGGVTWYPVAATDLPNTAGHNWVKVAVAADNPSIVAVVDRVAGLADRVYISLNGGAKFKPLGIFPAVTYVIESMDISSLAESRYLAVGGYNDAAAPVLGDGDGFVATWEIEIATAWVYPTALATIDTPAAFENCKALAFSKGFSTDQTLVCVNETIGGLAVNGLLAVDIYSFMFSDWNAGFEATFPRNLETSVAPAVFNCASASISLDDEFVIGDNELGFFGAEVTTPAATEVGGVYRFNTGTATVTQVYTCATTATGIRSVAWDGTNLMAAVYDVAAGGALSVLRCANALASSGWGFYSSSTFKTPGTGTDPLVMFNSGVAFCFSSGHNSAVAKSTDLGKSFDGVALVGSDFTDMIDFWVSNDGTRFYALTDDGTDVDVWAKADNVWKRVGILVAEFGNPWLVRAAQSDPDAVFLGKQATKEMYKSLDGGEFVWTKRTCTQLIRDFAVQNATTVYVAVSGAVTVTKSTTGAAGWLTPVSTNLNYASPGGGGNCYSINLVADDQLVVGGLTGGVSYSNNGATSWNYIASKITAAGWTLATSTLTDGVISTGDTIFAASSTGAGSDICKWVIGTNTKVTGWSYNANKGVTATATAFLTDADITGLVYANGVLYAWDDSAVSLSGKALYRFINPVVYVSQADDIIQPAGAAASVFDQTNIINALQYSTGSTTLWARDAVVGGADLLMYYIEYLGVAAVGPEPIYPINDAIITINSIGGWVNDFVFRWNCPPAISTAQWYTFDIKVFLDEAGTVLVGADHAIGGAWGGATSSTPSVLGTGAATWAITPTAFNPVPSTTYYWRVRTATPAAGYWSAMQTFSIQQLTSIVPTLSSPENGKEIDSTNPSFSWAPISGAVSYDFELDTGTTFAAPLYHTTAFGAGVDLPANITLEQGRTYFWRVRTLTPTEGEWSTIANFIVAKAVTTPTPTTTAITTTTNVTNTTITIPAATSTVITMPQTTQTVNEVNPTYIWAIIIIGAVLVLAVIVLIVRTRRSV